MNYKDLEIYKRSFELAIAVHELSLGFPKFELYEEGGQLRRSSKSIPAMIGEGWGRRYYKNEFIKFLIYALASCDETIVHLDFASRCGHISIEQHHHYKNEYDILGRKINKYLQYVMESHVSPRDKKQAYPGIAETADWHWAQDE
jgi:four helix bundle protein